MQEAVEWAQLWAALPWTWRQKHFDSQRQENPCGINVISGWRLDHEEQQLGAAPGPTTGTQETETPGTGSTKEEEEVTEKDVSGEDMVLHNLVSSHDCTWRRILIALPRPVLCGSRHIYFGGRLCLGTCEVCDHKARRSLRNFQLHMEFLSGRLYKRYIQLHSYLRHVFNRAVPYERLSVDTRQWWRWKLLFYRLVINHETDCNIGGDTAAWREFYRRSYSPSEYQGVRISPGDWLWELYCYVRKRKHGVSVLLLPQEPNCGSHPLRPRETRASDHPLLCCALYRVLGDIHSALRYVLRLSVWIGPVP